MTDEAVDIAEQFEKHLNSPNQTWLLGAGISFNANIPLMYPLTERVLEKAKAHFAADGDATAVLDFIQGDCAKDAHIETYLTHLSDIISLAERSHNKSFTLDGTAVGKSKLVEVHLRLLELISEIVRWGYRAASGDEEMLEGKPGESIVTSGEHEEFVKAIFGSNRAGLEDLRGAVELFTTNYDTLIEDALALHRIPHADGFTGGGVAFWNGYSDLDARRVKAVVTKLHGSIDWFRSNVSPSHLLRRRFGDTYPKGDGGAVMIYPQATKYLNAQVDPFSSLFNRFRNRLANGKDHSLMVCGYSFGDEHINADIEIAMSASGSQLNLIAFSNEMPDGALPETLSNWLNSSLGERIYVASSKGITRGTSGPFWSSEGGSRDWWTFSGATKLIANGLPSDVQELLP